MSTADPTIPTSSAPDSPSEPAPSNPAAFSPPDTTAASAAYALIDEHPSQNPSAVPTMPLLPDAALTREAIHDRISLIAARCELMLLDAVDRMAVRGLQDNHDLRKFDAVTLFLWRLTAVRKSLDAFQKEDPNAPTPDQMLNDLAAGAAAAGSAGVPARNPQTPSDTATPPPLTEPSETDPERARTPALPGNPQSEIRNPQSPDSQPSSPDSQPTTHNSQPSSQDLPLPTIHAVPSVPACRTLPLEAIAPALDKIVTKLLHPDSVINASIKPPRQKSLDEEEDERVESVRRYMAIRPDPAKAPTYFGLPGDPAYSPDNCPDCARCSVLTCTSRIAHPDFVTCARDCLFCPYNYVCPWTPQRFRTDRPAP